MGDRSERQRQREANIDSEKKEKVLREGEGERECVCVCCAVQCCGDVRMTVVNRNRIKHVAYPVRMLL